MEILQTTEGWGCTKHRTAAVRKTGRQEEGAAAHADRKGEKRDGERITGGQTQISGGIVHFFLFLGNVSVWEQGRKEPVCEEAGVGGYRQRAPRDSAQAAWQPAPV